MPETGSIKRDWPLAMINNYFTSLEKKGRKAGAT